MEAFGKSLKWLNPPTDCRFESERLTVTTQDCTDFWRNTYYGFLRDDGHFLYEKITGDFTLEVTVDASYESLYDQAGLMIRLCETHWVKAGIEYTNNKVHFSTVLTNENSDWSVVELQNEQGPVPIRIVRCKDSICTYFQNVRNKKWCLARVGYFRQTDSLDVGLMCCSPQRKSFIAHFDNYSLRHGIIGQLHE